MVSTINKLPFRDNVAGIVYKKDKYLLLQRIDWEDKYWKFPQGGVETGETDEQAISRELLEELGTNKFRILKKSSVTNTYDWDTESVIKAGNRWRGQIQRFFIVEFTGNDLDIRLPKEIKTYKWADKNNLKIYIDHSAKNYTNYFASVKKVLLEIKLAK